MPNEAALRRAAGLCDLKGIRHYLFLESDLEGQATAFATEPISGEIRKTFKKFNLWKEPKLELSGEVV